MSLKKPVELFTFRIEVGQQTWGYNFNVNSLILYHMKTYYTIVNQNSFECTRNYIVTATIACVQGHSLIHII